MLIMSTRNQKIGTFISQIRQDRNLTQKDFAKILGTSQSAVNRIEQGKQNLSLETIARISEALNKQIISIGSGSVNLKIEGGYELKGSVTLKTSKNAAVALLCASLLNYGVTKFKNFPRIEEVFRIIEVLESIGVKVKWSENNDIEIRRPEKLNLDNIDTEAAKKTRTVIMLIGSLMHEYTNFEIPFAGGCKLGERTIEPHKFALEEFGVKIKSYHGRYNVSVNKKNPQEVTLYEQGNTVTNNLLMAAAYSEDTIYAHGVSGDYMVQDLAYFLEELGMKIEGIGTPFLKITGVKNRIKKNVTFAPSEDPIEAMFFIAAAVTTNSKISIKRVPYRWIALELLKLKKMGLTIDTDKKYKALNGKVDLADITVRKHNGKLLALTDKLHPNLYPGLNPDNLPYFVLISCVAKGRTLIHDWIYENRAIYYTELTKVGVQIEIADPHRVYIHGPTTFSNADVVCPPALRPASLLLISMLAAEGMSKLRNIYTIARGYEDLSERLNSLGAHITIFQEI
jgi:UDP-N-acetylglucosamine 1-carboxyvinyltransferase